MLKIKSISYALIAAAAISIVAGCSTVDIDPAQWPAQRFYKQAQQALKIGDYQTAIKHFEDLEIRHPFSPYTQQAQLDVAYAYYKYDEPDSAIAAADRYIKLYPRADNVDYAYYLKGLVSYERSISGVDLAFNLDTSKRAPNAFKESYHFFAELVKRFPSSHYVDDAKQRMVYLRNHLAQYELHVADYYMRRGAYLAAANRAKYVVENYPQTTAIPDALAIMVRAYRNMGVNDLADDSLKVLQLNYPEHSATQSL